MRGLATLLLALLVALQRRSPIRRRASTATAASGGAWRPRFAPSRAIG